MKNDLFHNSEGYSDPTAGAAMASILRRGKAERKPVPERKYRPLVYICSRYAGDLDANVRAAKRYCRFAVESGYIPVASHLLYPQFLDDEDEGERELGLFFGKVLMDKCAEVWIFGSEMSEGMRAEYDRAVRKRYKVRRFTEDCAEVAGEDKGGSYGSV